MKGGEEEDVREKEMRGLDEDGDREKEEDRIGN